MNLNIIVHVQGKFADLKFTVFARSKQASIDTHALRNEVTLVWGSLRLAPITTKQLPIGHEHLFINFSWYKSTSP